MASAYDTAVVRPQLGERVERARAADVPAPIPRAPSHLPYIDGLRGVMALYVLAYHFAAWVPSELPVWITRLNKPLSFGHAAVSVFIVLSGYSLMLPVVRSPDQRLRDGAGGYIRRRAWRILPAYFAALCLGLLVQGYVGWAAAGPVKVTVMDVVTHGLLIHNLFESTAGTINMAHWSVGAEWQIYFFLPFLFLPVWRRLGVFAMVASGFAVAALPLLVLPTRLNLWWTCPWYVGLFAIGMAIATVDAARLPRSARFLLPIMSLSLATTYLLVHFSVGGGDDMSGPAAAWKSFVKDSLAGGIVAAFLLFATASAVGAWRKPMIVRLLEHPWCVAAGAFSYSLYLTHASVLDLCMATTRDLRLTDLQSFAFRCAVGVPVAVLLAIVWARLFEAPFMARRNAAKPMESPR